MQCFASDKAERTIMTMRRRGAMTKSYSVKSHKARQDVANLARTCRGAGERLGSWHAS